VIVRFPYDIFFFYTAILYAKSHALDLTEHSCVFKI